MPLTADNVGHSGSTIKGNRRPGDDIDVTNS